MENENMQNENMENENVDIYEKYAVFIDNLQQKFTEISNNIEKKWNGEDVQILLKNLTKMALQLRQLCNDLKNATGDDKIKIYSLIITNVIRNNILQSSKLTSNNKEIVNAAFGKDGLVESVIEEVSFFYKNQLINMDTNNNNYVSRREYKDYLTEKSRCCCGDNSNCSTGCKSCCLSYSKGVACCVTSTCFPLLSCCNKKGIKIKK